MNGSQRSGPAKYDTASFGSRAALLAVVALIVGCHGHMRARSEGRIFFSDLTSHSAEKPAIESMVAQGIMTSASPGKFNPDDLVTRGDFVVYAQRMFSLPPPNHVLVFPDVTQKDAVYPAVQAVAPFMNMQLLCPGCALSGVFSPKKPMTRAESTIVLVRIMIAQKKVELLSAEDTNNVLAEVADVKTMSLAARRYFATAVKNGIVTLGKEKSFQPALQHRRADTALLLDRIQKGFSIPVVPRFNPAV